MFTLFAGGGGMILALCFAVVAGVYVGYRFLNRTTSISPVHSGKKDTCTHKFDPEIVRARARRIKGPPPIDVSNLPPQDPQVAAVLQAIVASDLEQQVKEFSGGADTVVNGQTTRITTRNTYHKMVDVAMTKLEEEYAKLGLTTQRIKYNKQGRTFYNLEATLLGAVTPSKIVLVGSHIDCTAGHTSGSENLSSGADDDASGCIAVLTVAKALVALKKAGRPAGCTVRFLHFTGEEQGLWGSYTYSDRCDTAKDGIIGMYQMDMVGWCALPGNRVDIHDDVNRNGSHSLVERLVKNAKRYNLNLNTVDTHDHAVRDRSDQAGFLDHGYKAVLISEEFTDLGFNPNYHSLGDAWNTLNYPFMVEVTRMVLAAVAEEAGI